MDVPRRSRRTPAASPGPRTLSDLRVLAHSLDGLQEETALHSERVARLAFAVALELDWTPLRARELAQAALFHDVGKIIVPDGVLEKPGPLSDAELTLVKGHPEAGAQMVAGTLNQEQTGWILHHHEHYDGHGYPDHAAARDIPEGSRILGVVDAFDVMTSGRPYQAPISIPAAIARCTAMAGTQFDGGVVHALVRTLRPLPDLLLPPRAAVPPSCISCAPL